MILDRIVVSIRAAAGSLPVLAAVFRKKVRHLLPYPGETLAIGFRGDTKDVPAIRLSTRNMVPKIKIQRLSGSKHWSITFVQDSFSSSAKMALSTFWVRSGTS